LSLLALRQKKLSPTVRLMPIFIVALVVFQALLGMWTVTLKLLPVIILLHLLGGLTILSSLWWYFLTLNKKTAFPSERTSLFIWVIIGIVLLVKQIILGGLTSANYAALICPDFPYCQGELLPSMDLSVLFNINEITKDNTTLVTLHMLHRIGAAVVGVYLLCLALSVIILNKNPALRWNGLAILVLLTLQISLGILNIVWLLPITIAVGHNLVASLLLLSLVTLLFLSLNNNAQIRGRQ
jgi:cytochrome c oxidase assembly protein subunit 15